MKRLIMLFVATMFAAGAAVAQDKPAAKPTEAKKEAPAAKKDAAPAAKATEAKKDTKAGAKKAKKAKAKAKK